MHVGTPGDTTVVGGTPGDTTVLVRTPGDTWGGYGTLGDPTGDNVVPQVILPATPAAAKIQIKYFKNKWYPSLLFSTPGDTTMLGGTVYST